MYTIQWTGIKMDLSFIAVQDVIQKHMSLRPQVQLTIRVSEQGWQTARREVSIWNQANINSPVATYFNLYINSVLTGYDWTLEDDNAQVFVGGC